MDHTAVRDARPDDARFIVHMIRHMVADMAGFGGHAPATDDSAWETMAITVADELKGSKTKNVIAESADGDPIGVAGAQLITLDGAFAPKKTLHVSAVVVLPRFRRRGIGTALLATLMDWGRTAGSQECDLHVLSRNPAKSLYERHGFSAVEVKMVRSLQPEA